MIYQYFGNCITTVDSDNIWDASEMAYYIENCNPIAIPNVEDLKDGDRHLLKTMIKAFQKRPETFECGIGTNRYQNIMYLYDTITDIHYFFDICK